jgi:hypothetical protein
MKADDDFALSPTRKLGRKGFLFAHKARDRISSMASRIYPCERPVPVGSRMLPEPSVWRGVATPASVVSGSRGALFQCARQGDDAATDLTLVESGEAKQ